MKTQKLKQLCPAFACVALLLLMGTGCEKTPSPTNTGGCQKEIIDQIAKQMNKRASTVVVADSVKLSIYIDGSVSMRGFTNKDNLTQFATVVRDIEGYVLGQWPKGKPDVEYFKFSDGIRDIKKNEFAKTFRPDFYNGPDTNIDKVLASAKIINDNQLIVIVTDLFQNDADSALLNNKLQLLSLAHPNSALSLGILGIRAPFDGIVYDVGPMKHKFHYKSSSDSKSFRPFYILLLGKYATLQTFFHNMNAELLRKIPDDSVNAVIFSENALHTPLEYSKINALKGLTALKVQEPELQKYCRKFMLTKGIKQDAAHFYASLNVKPFPFAFQPNLSGGSVNIVVKRCPKQETKMEDASNVIPGARGELTDSTSKELNLRVHLEPRYFGDSSFYLFELTFTSIKTTYPKWFEEWDMDVSQISQWIQRPALFDGSRTQGLRSFLVGASKVFAPSSVKTYFILTRK